MGKKQVQGYLEEEEAKEAVAKAKQKHGLDGMSALIRFLIRKFLKEK